MRHRAALLSVVALTLLGAGACGKSDEPAAGSPAASALSPGIPAGGPSAAGPPAGTAPASGAPAGNSGGTPAGGATTRPGGGPPPGAAPPGGGPGKPGGGPGGGPAAKPGGTSTKPASATTLTAAGLGPYRVGAKRSALKSAGVLGKVDTSKGCADFVVAKGTSKYHAPTLVFYKGALQYTSVTSTVVTTAKGARVGMSYADVKSRHADGKELTDWLGAPAWFVTSGSDALLFRLKNDKVQSIEAGVAEPLQFRYTDGEGC